MMVVFLGFLFCYDCLEMVVFILGVNVVWYIWCINGVFNFCEIFKDGNWNFSNFEDFLKDIWECCKFKNLIELIWENLWLYGVEDIVLGRREDVVFVEMSESDIIK